MHFSQQFNRMLLGGLQHGKHGGGGMGGSRSSDTGTSHGSTRGSGGNFGSSRSRSSTAGHHESAKAESRTSSVGSSRNTSGGLGKGGGSFHGGLGGKASYGGGQTTHEAFSKSVGSSFSGGGHDRRDQEDKRATQEAIQSHTFSKQAATTDYGFKRESHVGELTGSGTLADMWQGVEKFFTKSPFTTPAGAFTGYGFQQASYEQTPMGDRSLSEQWDVSKLGTIGNLASNPFVSAGMWASGLGAVNLAVQAGATIGQMVEGDLDVTKGLGRLASKAITATPLGKGLGGFRGVAGAVLGDIGKAPEALAGFAGGEVGGMLGAGLGAMTGNPYVSAVSTVAGSVLGGKAAKSAMEDVRHGGVGGAMEAAARTSQRPMQASRNGADRDRRRPVQPIQQPTTPVGKLQTTGQQAVQSAQQLQSIDPDVLKYIPQGGYNPFAQGVSSYNPYR